MPGEVASLLVVAPHALDEVLGCGGVLAQAAQAGIPAATLVLFGDGQGHDARRREAAGIAAGILGTEPLRFTGLPENRADTFPLGEIIGLIETALGEIEPTHLYVPSANSLHIR
jgi:LmbE family N-acetylglucosaminyl deacetylase